MSPSGKQRNESHSREIDVPDDLQVKQWGRPNSDQSLFCLTEFKKQTFPESQPCRVIAAQIFRYGGLQYAQHHRDWRTTIRFLACSLFIRGEGSRKPDLFLLITKYQEWRCARECKHVWSCKRSERKKNVWSALAKQNNNKKSLNQEILLLKNDFLLGRSNYQINLLCIKIFF